MQDIFIKFLFEIMRKRGKKSTSKRESKSYHIIYEGNQIQSQYIWIKNVMNVEI